MGTDPNDIVSFAEAISILPPASGTRIADENPYTGEWIETDRYNTVVEPNRLIAQAGGDSDQDPLFSVRSDSYTIINPTVVYGHLEDVLREETYEGTPLAELAFGDIRQYRGGGEIHMDLMFDGLSVTLPDRNDPITTGVTSGYDFFGGNAV